MPKVSVIIAAYNEEQYIRDAVDSILNQTFEDFELIIVDDGSQDATPEILDSFRDDRLKVIHQENVGRYASNNVGIALAQGRYIANLDADDISLPQRLVKQVEYLDANPEVGMVGSFATIVDTETGEENLSPRPITDVEIRKNILKINPFIHSTVMIRKEVWDKVGPYSTIQPIWASDYEQWIRIMKYYKVTNIPEVLVVKRQHPENITSTAKLYEHMYAAMKARIKAIKLLHIPPYNWYQVAISFIGILLFRLGGFDKEVGYRMLFRVYTDRSFPLT